MAQALAVARTAPCNHHDLPFLAEMRVRNSTAALPVLGTPSGDVGCCTLAGVVSGSAERARSSRLVGDTVSLTPVARFLLLRSRRQSGRQWNR